MVVQQLAPWVSLLASVLTFGYVAVREWQQYSRSAADGDRSLGGFLARLDTFVYTAVTTLVVAGGLHYLLTFTPVTFLVVPVWLLAVFVIVATGATQAMPGESFEDKLERADRDLRAESEATATRSGPPSDGEPVPRERDGNDRTEE